MANVSIHYSATILDSFGVKRSTDAYLNIVDTTTLAVLAGDLGTWLTDLDAITDGEITASSVIIRPTRPGGLKAAPVAASYDAKTGQLSFSATGTSQLWGQSVPALAASAITAGKVPNTGSMGTYTALLLGGAFTNPQNQSLAALKKTAIGDRSSRKQQQGLTTSKF
jgi:hypothetical protein